ncbi:hypothetical protein SDC9_138589 [bioreactor metagenome]|uniref:Uncharacterized protein n=1 Tax=bioreactor metagenome TaxID=1076179 RepID=A0A645DPP2_9ZZZZ
MFFSSNSFIFLSSSITVGSLELSSGVGACDVAGVDACDESGDATSLLQAISIQTDIIKISTIAIIFFILFFLQTVVVCGRAQCDRHIETITDFCDNMRRLHETSFFPHETILLFNSS